MTEMTELERAYLRGYEHGKAESRIATLDVVMAALNAYPRTPSETDSEYRERLAAILTM